MRGNWLLNAPAELYEVIARLVGAVHLVHYEGSVPVNGVRNLVEDCEKVLC